MNAAALVCGNWGTTRLRAFCLDGRGNVCSEVRHGGGVGQIDKAAQAETWWSLTRDWTQAAPKAPHLICGGAGSNLGWLETGYVDCPAGLCDVIAAIDWRVQGGVRIGIVPGLMARNFLGEPDTMRSEETEIFGWLAGLAPGHDGVVCVPGTHTKWAVIEAGRVVAMLTGYVGELYASLRAGSVLTRGAQEVAPGPDFDAGVELGIRRAPGGLVHRLNSVRTRQIAGQLGAGESASFLSGLLVGSDVAGALDVLGPRAGCISVIASPALAGSYARALALLGQACETIDGDAACARGFAAFAGLAGSGD